MNLKLSNHVTPELMLNSHVAGFRIRNEANSNASMIISKTRTQKFSKLYKENIFVISMYLDKQQLSINYNILANAKEKTQLKIHYSYPNPIG